MISRTKIVCTVGPSVNSPEMIDALIKAGMNVARLNFSHGTHETHGEMIKMLKAARKKAQVPLAIMLDTKGPEMRIGKIKGEKLPLKKGDTFWFVKEQVEGDKDQITLNPSCIFGVLEKGTVVLLDDGYLLTRVVEVSEKGVKVEVDNDGVLRSGKSANIPNVEIPLPPLTEKDVEDIRFGCKHDIDIIAASFIRSADHVVEIKKLLEEEDKPEIQIIAKIESSSGVNHFDSIVQVADGIMVARGDLGVEVPLEQVPRLQKMMIRKCYYAGKISVTATQMLESMISHPRPTRAETSDVANAIYDSTSAVMLSGETAAGDFPIEATTVMKTIIDEAEKDFNYYEFLKVTSQRVFPDVPSSVALASVRSAYSSNAKAIFAFSTSGSTARLLSRFRPQMPIIAMTPRRKVYNQLALSWGVVPILYREASTIEEAFKQISAFALEKGYVKYGDLVIITAGSPFGKPGTTNMMIVDNIGDVLVRGSEGYGRRINGQVAFLTAHDSRKDYEIQGKIVVINRCNEDYLPVLENVSGVILQNNIDDIESETYLKKAAKRIDLPIILRAE
ncbi:MAG: Pyruvate kinase, partial [Chlamydiae bacterium]|nr:Pyruvate kinase [Chlamydiota bacterium]